MQKQTSLQTIIHFFLTKIIIGITVIAGMVFLTQSTCSWLLDRTALHDVSKDIITAIANSGVAVSCYIFLFRWYEKRRVTELGIPMFGRNAVTGFATGLTLQSLFVLIIYIAAGYTITQINPVSYLLPSFAASFTAGFVAEIIIIGVIFRLTEEKLGTVISLLMITLLFALLHLNARGATALSVLSTATQAGLMLSAAYVYSRSLWLPIFLHFAWDFTEPGIFGGINPGINIQQHLFTSTITGASVLTGGQSGPQNSIQALLLCVITGILFLWLAKKKNNFIQPYWKR